MSKEFEKWKDAADAARDGHQAWRERRHGGDDESDFDLNDVHTTMCLIGGEIAVLRHQIALFARDYFDSESQRKNPE